MASPLPGPMPDPTAWLTPDVERIRALAQRLDAEGQPALAALVRRAADDLEHGRPPGPPLDPAEPSGRAQ